MDKPCIAATHPKQVQLEPNKEYFFCVCGRSNNQPFCDGSHSGTPFTPQKFTVDTPQQAWLCRCKRTGNKPYCDGTHKTLTTEEIKHYYRDTSATDQAPPPKATPEEPTVEFIHELAQHGLDEFGAHGPMTAMGVPRNKLPHWDDIQILTAQLAVQPLQEEALVGTEFIVGPEAKKPLRLTMPLLISDMSFGSLSEAAKLALAQGAERAGTAICSGEGGMLPEEQASNSRYCYELASAQFGYDEALLTKIQAFHFKGGQAAKTGVGGHLPASKNVGKISQVRHLPEHTVAISPPTFRELHTPKDFKKFADHVREVSGGIPIGFKLSANHIEQDLAFALKAGADYIILDGRGGATGAAPLMFRDHISVPTIPALARARRYLDKHSKKKVTLIITGGLRTPPDFVKALALGADGIALANAAIQAVGCIAARICHTNQCPSGVATQDPKLSRRINVADSAQRVARFLQASVQLMQVFARACGHDHLNQFTKGDITSWKQPIAELAGIHYAADSL